MFNGIIFNIGVLRSITRNKNSIIISIQSNLKFTNKEIGSSVSCNGVCLTLEKIKGNLISFYLSDETLKRSNFKYIKIGQLINLEKSLKFGQYISGNFSQGHVDTIAKIQSIRIIDKSWSLILELKNKSQQKFLEEKASITINGVSLTISKVKKKNFQLNIIPHTLKLTNLQYLKKNDFVNVELDIFGKYINKFTS